MSRRNDDPYVEGLISGAPKRNTSKHGEPMDTSMNFAPKDEWTSEIYSRLDGGSRKDPKHGCLSCTVLIFSILIAFCGVGIIIMAYLEKQRHWLPLCPSCNNLVLGLYIAGGVVLAIGTLGIAAAVARIKCLAIPYTFLIVIVGLLFLGGGVFCVLVRENVDSMDLLSVWKATIRETPNLICELEGNLQCSGFSQGCCKTNYTAVDPYVPLANLSFCYLTLANGTFAAVNPSYTPITWPSDICIMGCKNNNFTTMCDVAIRNEIKEHIIPIAASMLPFGLLSLIIGIFSICMTRKKGSAR
jgi:hypothetical protein